MAPKFITSKYRSTCRICDGAISIGDRIQWARGVKPAHAACVDTEEQQQQQPVQPSAVEQQLMSLLAEVTHARDVAIADAAVLRSQLTQAQTLLGQRERALANMEASRDEYRELYRATRTPSLEEIAAAATVVEVIADEIANGAAPALATNQSVRELIEAEEPDIDDLGGCLL